MQLLEYWASFREEKKISSYILEWVLNIPAVSSVLRSIHPGVLQYFSKFLEKFP